MSGARGAWTRLPWLARWAACYLGAAALCGLAALATPLDLGGALFLGGAAGVLVSAGIVRLGGPRFRVAKREPRSGKALALEPVPEDERETEIRRGVGLFLLSVALWALIPLARL